MRYTTVGTLAVTQQQIDTQRALVQQQEAQIKSDQGVIDNARVQLGYTTITSPLTGRIGFRLVDQGNIVHADDLTGVASIAQIEPIAVIFTAPEEQVPRINEALKSGPLPVIAYTSDGKMELDKGPLALVDNQVDATTGTIRLKAEFANKDHKLWPSLTVATRLLIETLQGVVVVPDVAVQRGPDGLFAYVVGKDGKAEMRKLAVGVIEDGHAVITQGLQPGERVVTSGYYRLQPGSLVQIRDAGNADESERHADRRARGRLGHEHLRALHPVSDRHLAADGRHALRRPRRLPDAAGRAAAAGRFPDHPGLGRTSRRQSRNDGVDGRPAAGAPVRTNPRRVADDLDQRARLRPIAVQFDLDRNIDAAAQDVQAAINAAGGQLPQDLPSPPTYRKVNPADSPILLLSVHSESCR